MNQYPTLLAYNNAVAAPEKSFFDAQLKRTMPVKMKMGLPSPFVGGFAATYHLRKNHGAGQDLAMRCFHRENKGLHERYAHITRCLASNASPHFLRFEFQEKGILVEKAVYPILVMEWAHGEVLTSTLRRCLRDRGQLAAILSQLLAAHHEMNVRGMAHGDLQPDNIMWDGSKLRLIDYDGMFVPGMTVGAGAEKGHRHFQHPARTGGGFGPLMDRFSVIVLALSLRALMFKPQLHETFAVTGDNLLFTEDDYKSPSTSEAFKAVAQIPDMTSSMHLLARICQGPYESIPSFDEFRRGLHASEPSASSTWPGRATSLLPARPSAVMHTPERGYHRAISAECVNNPFFLVGTIKSCRRLKTCQRLILEDSHGTQAVVHLFDDAALVHASKYDLYTSNVAVFGRVNEVRRPKDTPKASSIELHFRIDDPKHIRYLTDDEAENMIRSHEERLAAQVRQDSGEEPRPPPAAAAPSVPSPQRVSFTSRCSAALSACRDALLIGASMFFIGIVIWGMWLWISSVYNAIRSL
jgi:hypothetical protein